MTTAYRIKNLGVPAVQVLATIWGSLYYLELMFSSIRQCCCDKENAGWYSGFCSIQAKLMPHVFWQWLLLRGSVGLTKPSGEL